MTLIVKVRDGDGIIDVNLCEDWQLAVRNLNEFRSSGKDAWIENVDGRLLDENTGQVKT